MLEQLSIFLLSNGFKRKNKTTFTNIFCTIRVKESLYEIRNLNDEYFYSDDLSIYWLIGILTYNRYIDRDYKG